MKRFLQLAGIIVVGIVITAGIAFYLQSQPGSSDPAKTEGPHGEGVFGPYRFVYMSERNTYVAVFTPLLAHDDVTLVGAVRAVVRTVYSADVSKAVPEVVGREIAFPTINGTYFVFPIKQVDSGQVHTIVVRFVPK